VCFFYFIVKQGGKKWFNGEKQMTLLAASIAEIRVNQVFVLYAVQTAWVNVKPGWLV
jgi:hypothetical protein